MNDLEKKYNMSEKELFSRIDHDSLESEVITAPRYSYWQSVFKVFFRKKINIVILSLLLFIILFTYIYPAIFPYDADSNLLNGALKHLSPSKAIEANGFALKWILGSGASGQSTFDQMWNGARISISLAFVCAAINMSVGVVLGAVWGFSKKFDMIMTEVYNIIGNIPYILMISVLVMLFTASFGTMVFALTITGRRKSCFHQLKIYKQSSGSTVTINKRMNALKLDMKTSQFCYYMLCTFRKITQQLFHLRYNKIRLYRFMLRTHNTNRNSTVDATVFFLINKD